MDTIATKIPFSGQTNAERGLPDDSYYIVTFEDGSTRNEKNTNWSAFSEVREVEYFGHKKQVALSKFRIAKIEVFHGELHTELEVPAGCRVYQAMYSESVFVPNGNRLDTLNGRGVGIVKNGTVIEERFLNARQHEVNGIRL